MKSEIEICFRLVPPLLRGNAEYLLVNSTVGFTYGYSQTTAIRGGKVKNDAVFFPVGETFK